MFGALFRSKQLYWLLGVKWASLITHSYDDDSGQRNISQRDAKTVSGPCEVISIFKFHQLTSIVNHKRVTTA